MARTRTTDRHDPLEAGARMRCIQDGHDPDERIPLPPGSTRMLDAHGVPRTRPRWTQYRDTAGANHGGNASYTGPSDAILSGVPTHIVGDHEESTIDQLRQCLIHGDAVQAALCADGHPAYFQPVGSAIAYKGQTSISGVGPDIACGNAAIRLDILWTDIRDKATDLFDAINATISFGITRKTTLPWTTSILDTPSALKDAGIDSITKRIRDQFGTIGGGNHYADIFVDTDGYVWVGVHFGSRGLGAHIFRTYSTWSGAGQDIHSPHNILSLEHELGARYHTAMTLAGTYAWEGRTYVLEQIHRILGGHITHYVHNYHNYAFTEDLDGTPVIVVRKGSTPAYHGMEGFVGGSMGDDAVIVAGRASPNNTALLGSTIHGAGRPMSRRQALQRFRPHDMRAWMQDKQIHLYGGSVDESPMAYRRLDSVLTAHEGSIDIVYRLTPVAVFMAGDDTIDPYKD